MRVTTAAVISLSLWLFGSHEVFAQGALDRVRQQADRAAEAARDVSREVDAVEASEAQAEADLQRARTADEELGSRAETAVSESDEAGRLAQAERDARQVERELEQASDVEGRARAEVQQSEAGAAAAAAVEVRDDAESAAAAVDQAADEVRDTRDRLRRTLRR